MHRHHRLLLDGRRVRARVLRLRRLLRRGLGRVPVPHAHGRRQHHQAPRQSRHAAGHVLQHPVLRGPDRPAARWRVAVLRGGWLHGTASVGGNVDAGVRGAVVYGAVLEDRVDGQGQVLSGYPLPFPFCYAVRGSRRCETLTSVKSSAPRREVVFSCRCVLLILSVVVALCRRRV